MFTQMCASVATGTISRKPGTGVKSKITSAVKTIVEQQMQLDDETLYVHVKLFKRNSKPFIQSFLLSLHLVCSGAFFLRFVGTKRNLFRVLYCIQPTHDYY